MGNIEVISAYAFQGMKASRTTTGVYESTTQYSQSKRRGPLESPLLIHNMVHSGRGDLWLPPEATSYVDLSSSIGSRWIRNCHTITLPGSAAASWHIITTTDGTNFRIEKVRLDTTVNTTDDGVSWPITFSETAYDIYGLTVIPVFDSTNGWVFSASGFESLYELRPAGTYNDPVTSTATVGLKWISKDTGAGAGTDSPRGGCQAWYNGRRFTGYTPDYDGKYNRLWYSDLNTPFSTGASNYIDLSTANLKGAVSKITALIPYNDALYIFTEADAWVLRGSDSTNFDLERLNINISHVGPKAIDEYSGLLYLYSGAQGSEGVYSFDGNSVTQLSADINEYFAGTSGMSTEAQFAYGTSLCVHDGRLILCAPRAGKDDYTSEIFIGDLNEDPNKPKWSVHGNWWSSTAEPHYGLTCYRNYAYTQVYGSPPYLPFPAKWLFAVDDDLYGGHNSWNRAPSSKGTVTFLYEDLEAPHLTKRFLSFKAIAWRSNGTGTPTIKATFTDPAGNTRNETKNITATASGSKDAELVWPVNFRGNSLKISLEVTAAATTNGVVLEGVELHCVPKGDKGGLN